MFFGHYLFCLVSILCFNKKVLLKAKNSSFLVGIEWQKLGPNDIITETNIQSLKIKQGTR